MCVCVCVSQATCDPRIVHSGRQTATRLLLRHWRRRAPRRRPGAGSPVCAAWCRGQAARGDPRGREGDAGCYLPMAEHQLRAGQTARPLPDLIRKPETLGDRQRGLDDEHVCPFFHFFLEHSAFSLGQDSIDPTCKATPLLNALSCRV